MEAKWSSLVSYGLSLDARQDFLPLDLSLDVKTVRDDTLKAAKRLEAELGDKQSRFLEGDPRETVNAVVSKRFCKQPQMQWSKAGAHWLLQTHVRSLNGE